MASYSVDGTELAVTFRNRRALPTASVAGCLEGILLLELHTDLGGCCTLLHAHLAPYRHLIYSRPTMGRELLEIVSCSRRHLDGALARSKVTANHPFTQTRKKKQHTKRSKKEGLLPNRSFQMYRYQ